MKIIFCILVLIFSRLSYTLINGDVQEDDFPSVQLVFKNKSHVCSGTFLDEYTILTAAHCIKEPRDKWNGFSLELERIFDKAGKEIQFVQFKNIPHPSFKYGAWKSKHDIGVIKVKKNNFFKNFPQIGNNNSGKSRLYGCGRVNLNKKKERKCLVGENRLFSLMSFLLSWGESRNIKNDGENVSVAPNDSGGAVVDIASNRIVGVHWGETVTIMNKYGLPSLSMMTSLELEENFKFVLNYLGDIKTE